MMGSSLSLTLDEIPLDSVSIPRESLDLDDKERSNLLPWNGQFSPQLVEVLLRTFSSPGNRICDPFLGSGTVNPLAAAYRPAGPKSTPPPSKWHPRTGWSTYHPWSVLE